MAAIKKELVLNLCIFLHGYNVWDMSLLFYAYLDVVERAVNLELQQFGVQFQLCLQFTSN